jgi:hypothetical protein
MNNYDLSGELKEKIRLVLEEKIDEWLMKNWMKQQHIKQRAVFQSLWDESLEKNDDEWYFKYYYNLLVNNLFFSVEETELITDKVMYDKILSNWNWSKWYNDILSKNVNNFWIEYFELNLNNYIWRVILSWLTSMYKSQFQKEQDLRKLRADILGKLE